MFSPGIRANWDVANMWSIQWIPKDLHCITLFLTNCLFGRKQVALGKMKPSTSKYVCRVTLPVKKDGSHQSPILWRLYESASTNRKRRLPNAIGLGHPDTTEGSLNGFLLWIFSQDFGSKNGTSGCSEDNFDHQIQIV